MTDERWLMDTFEEQAKHPVRLLWDRDGIYGIGVKVGEPEAYSWGREMRLVLRPDLLAAEPDRHLPSVLQPIFGGFRRGLFWNSLEEVFRREIHHKAASRQSTDVAWVET
jgi:hypothetical protein